MQKRIIVGIDEVGRGPLAGPVIACAFYFNKVEVRPPPYQVRDSKQLTAKQREEIYKKINSNPNVFWGIGRVSEKVIDKINILQATKLAMVKAVEDLQNKLKKKIDFLQIDGNFALPAEALAKAGINCPQESIIKGDEKVSLIATASIVAKVTRDRLMLSYHKKYPQYCFDQHKGYSTALHRQKIKEHGFCPIHRRSFRWS
jgi:ribonuclease HII